LSIKFYAKKLWQLIKENGLIVSVNITF